MAGWCGQRGAILGHLKGGFAYRGGGCGCRIVVLSYLALENALGAVYGPLRGILEGRSPSPAVALAGGFEW